MSAAVVASPRRSRDKTIAQKVDEATTGLYYIHLGTDAKGQPRETKVVLSGAYFKWGIKTDEKGAMVATATQAPSKRTDPEFVYLPGLRLAGKDSVLRQRFPQYFGSFNYEDAAKLTINNFNRGDLKISYDILALAPNGKDFVSRGKVEAPPLEIFNYEINQLKAKRGERNRTDSHIDKLNELLGLFYLAQQQQSYVAQVAAPGQAAPISARRGRGTLRERMVAAQAAGKGLNVNNFDAKGTGASQANVPQGPRAWVVRLGPPGHWLYPAFITRSDRQQNALVFLEKLGYNPQEAQIILTHALSGFSKGFPVGDPGSGVASAATPTSVASPVAVQPSVTLPGPLPQLPAGVPSGLPSSVRTGALSIIPELASAQPRPVSILPVSAQRAPSVFPTTISQAQSSALPAPSQGAQPMSLPMVPSSALPAPSQGAQPMSLPMVPSSALPAPSQGAQPFSLPMVQAPAQGAQPFSLPMVQAPAQGAQSLAPPQVIPLPESSQIPSIPPIASAAAPASPKMVSSPLAVPQSLPGIPGSPQLVSSSIPGLTGAAGVSSPSSSSSSSPVTAATLHISPQSQSGSSSLELPAGFEDQ